MLSSGIQPTRANGRVCMLGISNRIAVLLNLFLEGKGLVLHKLPKAVKQFKIGGPESLRQYNGMYADELLLSSNCFVSRTVPLKSRMD